MLLNLISSRPSQLSSTLKKKIRRMAQSSKVDLRWIATAVRNHMKERSDQVWKKILFVKSAWFTSVPQGMQQGGSKQDKWRGKISRSSKKTDSFLYLSLGSSQVLLSGWARAIQFFIVYYSLDRALCLFTHSFLKLSFVMYHSDFSSLSSIFIFTLLCRMRTHELLEWISYH